MVLMGKLRKILQILDWKGNNILLFGSEALVCINIHQNMQIFWSKLILMKKIESLNISNTAAIVFHHLSQYKKKS